MAQIWPDIAQLDGAIAGQLAVDARYAVYIARQELDIAAFRKDEAIAIPPGFTFAALPGLSSEAITAAAVPMAVLCIWLLVRRIRRHHAREDANIGTGAD